MSFHSFSGLSICMSAFCGPPPDAPRTSFVLRTASCLRIAEREAPDDRWRRKCCCDLRNHHMNLCFQWCPEQNKGWCNSHIFTYLFAASRWICCLMTAGAPSTDSRFLHAKRLLVGPTRTQRKAARDYLHNVLLLLSWLLLRACSARSYVFKSVRSDDAKVGLRFTASDSRGH